MKQTRRVLADRIDNATWDQHRETIHRLFILQNRKLEGPEGVMHVMSKVHGFSATEAQYEKRFKLWNIRKKITDREWSVVLSHVHVRAQHSEKTDVIFNGALLDEERVAREINRRVSKYNMHLNNLQNLPKLPLGFRLESPPSSPVPHADNAISGHNPTGCVDQYLKPAIASVVYDWLRYRRYSQPDFSLLALTSSDTTWKYRIAPERYRKQQRHMLEKRYDESPNFYPSCMDDYAYEHVSDELKNMGAECHSIKWEVGLTQRDLSSFRDRYVNSFSWGFEGDLRRYYENWHCDDCSNCQESSPVFDQCMECCSTDGTLLIQGSEWRVRLKLVVFGIIVPNQRCTVDWEFNISSSIDTFRKNLAFPSNHNINKRAPNPTTKSPQTPLSTTTLKHI